MSDIVEEFKENLSITRVHPKSTAPSETVQKAREHLSTICTTNEQKSAALTEPESLYLRLNNIEECWMNVLRCGIYNDVPTVAFERIFIMQNNSVIPDEMLVDRLYQVPIHFDATLLDYPTIATQNFIYDDVDPILNDEWFYNYPVSHKEAIFFELKVDARPKEPIHNQYFVYGESLRWIPNRNQRQWINKGQAPKVAQSQIPLVKVHPRNEIHILLMAMKGVGRRNCKFSSVCPVWYACDRHVRLLPQWQSADVPMATEAAYKLKELLPKGMVKVDDSTGQVRIRGKHNPSNPILNQVDYASIAIPELRPFVIVEDLTTYFVLAFESVGNCVSVKYIVEQALLALERKCDFYINSIIQSSKKASNRKKTPAELQQQFVDGVPVYPLNGSLFGLQVTCCPAATTSAPATGTSCTCIFEGESNEWGTLLVHYLSLREDVSFAASREPHRLQTRTILSFVVQDSTPNSVLKSVLETLKSMTQILKEKALAAVLGLRDEPEGGSES